MSLATRRAPQGEGSGGSASVPLGKHVVRDNARARRPGQRRHDTCQAWTPVGNGTGGRGRGGALWFLARREWTVDSYRSCFFSGRGHGAKPRICRLWRRPGKVPSHRNKSGWIQRRRAAHLPARVRSAPVVDRHIARVTESITLRAEHAKRTILALELEELKKSPGREQRRPVRAPWVNGKTKVWWRRPAPRGGVEPGPHVHAYLCYDGHSAGQERCASTHTVHAN